jgi:hypothetical protein
MRVLAIAVATALVGLVALVPGATAQTSFTGFEPSSTGLISEEGFITVGTTLECATEMRGAFVLATLEQQTAEGTATAFGSAGHQAAGPLCAPTGSPLAVGFSPTSPVAFEPGPALISMEACLEGECISIQRMIELRSARRSIAAALPPEPRSVFDFRVSSRAVLETTGVVTVGVAVSCGSVRGPGISGTLTQRHGKRLAEATANELILGGCGGLHPLPLSFIPVEGSDPFEPRGARISLTVCAGPTGDFECATIEGHIKLVEAE